MKVLNFFGRKESSSPDQAIAHRLKFKGQGTYPVGFAGSGYGVVFEDDGNTGYLYATNETHDEIFDALHIYNSGTPEQFRRGTAVFIVWHRVSQKAGLYVRRDCHAVIDFKNQVSCCRTGFPKEMAVWQSNQWMDRRNRKGAGTGCGLTRHSTPTRPASWPGGRADRSAVASCSSGSLSTDPRSSCQLPVAR